MSDHSIDETLEKIAALANTVKRLHEKISQKLREIKVQVGVKKSTGLSYLERPNSSDEEKWD